MRGFIQDIDALTLDNRNFRRVLYTADNCQLVLMSLEPDEEIGMETHDVDQFFRVEEGSGEVVLDGVTSRIGDGFAIVIPAGAAHNIVNTGAGALKLYSLYSPPHHRDGVVHRSRSDAMRDEEHFDGMTTEMAGAAPLAATGTVS